MILGFIESKRQPSRGGYLFSEVLFLLNVTTTTQFIIIQPNWQHILITMINIIIIIT
jgi:hypothetical protein